MAERASIHLSSSLHHTRCTYRSIVDFAGVGVVGGCYEKICRRLLICKEENFRAARSEMSSSADTARTVMT